MGNRTASHLATGQVHDAANRLREDSAFTYTYDANGNLTSKTTKATGARTVYTYSVENQLLQVDQFTLAGGPTPTLTATYRYDQEDILLELDGANQVLARYTHGPGIDEALIMLRGTQAFFYHPDALGSIGDLTDSAGSVPRSYTYDSFGNLLAQPGTLPNSYTYTGREGDPETGLYYYRARYYDPTMGRFLQEDPTEFAGGDVNFYMYVTNNPLTSSDPFGLRPITRRTAIPTELRKPPNLCGPRPKKVGPDCPPKPPILEVFQLVAAVAVIETGAEIARGGVLLTAAGGPAGVVVGVPVTLLGLGIVAVGVHAIPGVDLGILPKCI